MTPSTPQPAGRDKLALRHWARPILAAHGPAASPTIVAVIGDHLIAAGGPGLGAGARTMVLTYRAMATEIDLAALEALPGLDVDFAVTRTPDTGPLSVHRADEPGERHRFGFFQPTAIARPLDPVAIDVALVPGLVFDRSGNRIGRGAGYYDELLGRLRPDATLIGVTLDELVVDMLVAEDHDQPMTHLATSSGLHQVS